MSSDQFPNKLVTVLNKSIAPGKVMNALAHMSISPHPEEKDKYNFSH